MSKKQKQTQSTCIICQAQFEGSRSGKRLSNHIRSAHGMSSENYTVQYFFNGVRPTCPVCNVPTRYSALNFKKYCAEHSFMAESEGGKKGGIAPAWNKDQTVETDERIARQAEKMRGPLNHFYGKHHNDVTKIKMSANKRISRAEFFTRVTSRSDMLSMTSYEDYTSRQEQYLNFTCSLCGTISEKTLQAFERGSLCRKCHPITSQSQLEIAEFIKTLTGELPDISTRNVISPLELDIWIPSKRLALEYHGLYWHSGGRNGTYDSTLHRRKYLMCKESEIRLIQIFSDEWATRRQQTKAIIRDAIMPPVKDYYPSDCVFMRINEDIAYTFINENGLAMHENVHEFFGMVSPVHGILCITGVRELMTARSLELVNIVFQKETSQMACIDGLVSGLRALVGHRLDGLTALTDLRYDEGFVFSKCNFIRQPDIENFWHTNGVTRTMDSEQEIGKVNGCGNAVYTLKWR